MGGVLHALQLTTAVPQGVMTMTDDAHARIDELVSKARRACCS